MRPDLPDDPARLRAWRDATLYRLMLRASEAERRETVSRLRQRGYQDVTGTDTALLANLDTADTTISALARRCGVTRQATSAGSPTRPTAGPSWSGGPPRGMR